MNKNLHKMILDPRQPVIFYELLPPENNGQVNIDAYIDCAIDLLTSTHITIDAVNIPEIHDEDHSVSQRTQHLIPKMNPAVFASMLEKASHNQIKVVLNRGTVYLPLEKQAEWVKSILKKHKINTIILVGGSNSTVQYPGPSVLEMGDFIQKNYQQQILRGGIALQSRRHSDLKLDETARLIQKGLHGLEFFTTQIIYESQSIIALFRDYANLCQEQGLHPKRIFLSFAPVSTKKDLDFMQWLGVNIPSAVKGELCKTDIGMGWRSIKIAATILEEILDFMNQEKIRIPLGLNIEHITRHNFELSREFIERLGEIYYANFKNHKDNE